MSIRPIALASAAAVAVSALAPGFDVQAASEKYINVHGDPAIILALIPTHLPDGKPIDQVFLLNRSKRTYCFKFEIYDDAFIYVPKRVTVMTAPPNSGYQVTKVKIIASGGKYRFKYAGVYAPEGMTDCRKADFSREVGGEVELEG